LPLTSIVASGTSQHPGDVFNVPVTRSVSMGGVGAMTLEQLQPSNGRFGQQELLTPATRIIQGKGSASPVVPSRMAPIGQAKLQIGASQSCVVCCSRGCAGVCWSPVDLRCKIIRRLMNTVVHCSPVAKNVNSPRKASSSPSSAF
jgi:hypothetical protein